MSPYEKLGATLLELARQEDRLVILDADQSAASWASELRSEIPDRFIQAGVADGNLVGMAFGLCLSDELVPLAIGPADALARRSLAQTADTLSRPKRNVKFLALATLGQDRRRAFAAEEIAALRAMPNMAVVEPADLSDAAALLSAALQFDGPVYLRLVIHGLDSILGEDYAPTLGEAEQLCEGDEVTILSTGVATYAAVRAAEALSKEGARARVRHVHTVEPLDREYVQRAARKTLGIVAAECHSSVGGLGSAVAECVTEESSCLVRRVGVGSGASATSDEALIEEMTVGIVENAKYILDNA